MVICRSSEHAFTSLSIWMVHIHFCTFRADNSSGKPTSRHAQLQSDTTTWWLISTQHVPLLFLSNTKFAEWVHVELTFVKNQGITWELLCCFPPPSPSPFCNFTSNKQTVDPSPTITVFTPSSDSSPCVMSYLEEGR